VVERARTGIEPAKHDVLAGAVRYNKRVGIVFAIVSIIAGAASSISWPAPPLRWLLRSSPMRLSAISHCRKAGPRRRHA
jgi:hypothetical protein